MRGGLLVKHGKRLLTFTTTGNLEFWTDDRSRLLWQSGTGDVGTRLAMQDDGNLVIYDTSGKPIWDSATSGHRGAVLAVQDHDALVIYSAEQEPLWRAEIGPEPEPQPEPQKGDFDFRAVDEAVGPE